MESMFAKHFGPASESKGDPSVGQKRKAPEPEGLGAGKDEDQKKRQQEKTKEAEKAKKAAEETAKKKAEELAKKKAEETAAAEEAQRRLKEQKRMPEPKDETDKLSIADLSSPTAKLFLARDGLGKDNVFLQSLEISNKKISRDLCFRRWTANTELVLDRTSKFHDDDFLWRWDVDEQTKLWCQEPQKVLTLKEYVKKHVPEATTVYTYAPFRQGEMPKQLVPAKHIAAKILNPALLRLFRVSLAGKSCSIVLLWSVTYDPAKKTISPTGIALANPTQFSLIAGQTLSFAEHE
jgi:hypothetical protein